MPTVLKLGGSVITEKDREGTLASDRLGSVAAAMAVAEVDGLVLVTGGGSFGHPAAKRHGVSATDGTRDPVAIAEVHGAMLDLVAAVVDELHGVSVPAVAVHPLSLAHRDGDDLEVSFDVVEAALAEGFVPVLHGDGVVTAGRGVTILSGDELVVALGSHLGADRLGLLTGAPGVLDADGAVIERIDRFEEVADLVGTSDSTDVTGGMAGKVRALLELAVPASVFGLDDLEAFLAGGEPGTTVLGGHR
ncbi:MAG: isopentenyl phosphate kinase [Halobacteriales archaeon]